VLLSLFLSRPGRARRKKRMARPAVSRVFQYFVQGLVRMIKKASSRYSLGNWAHNGKEDRRVTGILQATSNSTVAVMAMPIWMALK